MKVGVLTSTILALLIGLPMASFAGTTGDLDNDGVPDGSDNCVLLPNGGTAGCDTDIDGYGNACDGDYNNDNFVTGSPDFVPEFRDDFNAGSDSGIGSDMNCDGFITGSPDFIPLFRNQFNAGTPGPSGLPCAGTPGCTP